MRQDNTDIEKIINGSELREIADFLSDPNNEITSCILCYETTSDIGYKLLESSSLASLIGLLGIFKKELGNQVSQMLADENEEE